MDWTDEKNILLDEKEEESTPLQKWCRRDFLKSFLCAGAALLLPAETLARVAGPTASRERVLTLYSPNTGESLKEVTFWQNGHYYAPGLRAINYFCRDTHNNTVHAIDPALLDKLYLINQCLPGAHPQNILLSGYRSPSTNARLRRHNRRVARQSYHMEGKALDIRVKGVSVAHLRNVALRLHQGGVGYYPRSGFVHIDTGPLRTW